MKRYLIIIALCLVAVDALGQVCPDTPDLSSLEILCDYEDPFNLEAAAGDIEGAWSVTPIDGNVFVYLGWLYYQGASPGDYTLRLDVTNSTPSCPVVYEFNVQLVTTALVWPIPQPVCPGEAFYVGDIPLVDEGFHEVYLPAELCDSLVQVILFHDDNVCEDDSVNAQGNNDDSVSDDNVGVDVGAVVTVDESGGTELGPKTEEELGETDTDDEPTANSGGLDLPNVHSHELVYPTAFSPDYNGINDTFGLINSDLDLSFYTIRIYDRWGGEIFVSTVPDERWNGICRGKSVPNGVYTVTARARTSNGEELWYSGSLTLLR